MTSLTKTLRDALNKEHANGASFRSIAADLGIITQPGLCKFAAGDSDGGGALLDALADRYSLHLVFRARKKPKPVRNDAKPGKRTPPPGDLTPRLASLRKQHKATTVVGRIARHDATADVRTPGGRCVVTLRPGWCLDSDGEHTIDQASATAALNALANVEACLCNACAKGGA